MIGTVLLQAALPRRDAHFVLLHRLRDPAAGSVRIICKVSLWHAGTVVSQRTGVQPSYLAPAEHHSPDSTFSPSARPLRC